MDAEEHSAVELTGRSRELGSIARGFERSRKDGVPLIIGIEGDAGIGKSTLLHAGALAAQRDKWIVARATCYAVQSQIPLTVVRQFLRSALEAIGNERARYVTGLEALLESGKPESAAQAFARLLEGVTLDRPVLLALDDAQWADRDSLQLIRDTMTTLADRAIVGLFAKRPQMESVLPVPEIDIPLQPLDGESATAVARRLMADAPAEIVDAVVNHARGYPLDIVALSRAIGRVARPSIDDVASSRRSAIARDVQTATPELREFLQICSLMDGPIGYRLLEQLWPEPQTLDALVGSAIGRFLRITELGVEFDHALIAEGIRHTIAVPVPYRRKIIAALQRLDSPTLEDLQTLASQLAECGDRAGAFNVLAGVAKKAAASGQMRLTVSASARALTFAEPPADVARTFLPDYADALFALDRDSEAVTVLERGLRVLGDAGTGIPGPAIARLIIAQCFSDQVSAAESTYARFLPTMTTDEDRAHVMSAAFWFAACNANLELADTLEKQLLALPCELPFQVKIRMRNFKAFVLALHGRHEAAATLIDEAVAIADEATLMGRVGITSDQRNAPRLILSHWEYGTRVLEPLIQERFRARGDSEPTPADEYFLTLSDFLGGSWDRAEARIAGIVDGTTVRPTAKRRFFTVAAAIAALRQIGSPYRKPIEADVSAFLLGHREGWYVPLAAWWAVATAESEPKTARTVLSHLLSQLDKPADPHVYMPALSIVLLAHRLRDDATLALLASKPWWTPKTPWHSIHNSLAKAIARGLMGQLPDLSAEIPHARELGLNVYADLAATMQSKSDVAASTRLAALGIKWLGAAAKPANDTFVKPTARELQVASLVAAGNSNQQIADTLVLSQRTVEVHISNLFNKVGVSSRTQLATWYVRREATG